MQSLQTAEGLTLHAGRCAHLRLDPSSPVVPAVDANSLRAIYVLFRRNLLKALEVGVTAEFGSANEEQRAAQLKANGSSTPDAVPTTIVAQGRDR